MNLFRLLYLIVFTMSFATGIYVYKYNKALYILVGLMGLGLLTEYIAEINTYIEITNEAFIYNLYIPLEYLFYTAFFYFINTNVIIKKVILISIPLFIISILLFSEFKAVSVVELATDIYTFSGILTMTWSIWTLFVTQPIKGLKSIKHPLIWICAGLIIFYSGITPFNLGHNILKEINPEIFSLLSGYISKGFNIFLYISFSIGFICSHRMKT